MRNQYTPPIPITDRFWSHIRKAENPKGCWLWLLKPNKGGYGLIRADGGRGMVYVHRFSYELHIGPIPDGMEVCHTCDVRLCVNPAHFFLGSHVQNIADMLSKSRQARGEKHGHTTLTEQQVREIRSRYDAGGVKQITLAREYGVSKDTMSSLVRRKLWKHVA